MNVRSVLTSGCYKYLLMPGMRTVPYFNSYLESADRKIAKDSAALHPLLGGGVLKLACLVPQDPGSASEGKCKQRAGELWTQNLKYL